MGKGLSKTMMAALRHTLDCGGWLLVQDILKVMPAWQAKPGEQYDGSQIFNRASIGAQQYSKAHSTLSRALKRLRQRGLVQIYKSKHSTAICLTGSGQKEAGEIHWETEAEAP